MVAARSKEAELLTPDENRLVRIEKKLDQLGEGMLQLVRIDERMVTLFRRMDRYDDEQKAMLARINAEHARNASRLSEIERLAFGRGLIWRWLRDASMAMIGGGAAILLQQITR